MSEPRDYVIDDVRAVAPLADLGWQVDTVPWDRPGVAWGDYEVVVIRSTWDYHHRPDAFAARLAEIERSGTRLENNLAIVRWNMEKTYLRDLASRRVPTVPTAYRPALRHGDLELLFDELGDDEVVVKPVVGASAEGAYRLDRQTARERAREVESYYADRALMVQPLVRSVLDEGEHSLFYFEGEYSHAVLKAPAGGDFRAQEERGAEVRSAVASAALREAGAAVLAALEERLLYARVDLVRAGDGESFQVMELELVEPSLYLRCDADAPARFAAALDARMSRRRDS